MKRKTFKCAACGGTFEQEWSEEEALAELERVFPGWSPDDCSVICDDCHSAMKDNNHAL